MKLLEHAVGLASERVRARMVARVREQGVRDPRVLAAMDARATPPFRRSRARQPCVRGHGAADRFRSDDFAAVHRRAQRSSLRSTARQDLAKMKMLEIGTGCGYAAAVLAQLVGTVVSIERVRALHELARDRLRALRIAHLRLVFGDGRSDWKRLRRSTRSSRRRRARTCRSPGSTNSRRRGASSRPWAATSSILVISRDDAGKVHRQVHEAVRFVPLRPGTLCKNRHHAHRRWSRLHEIVCRRCA